LWRGPFALVFVARLLTAAGFFGTIPYLVVALTESYHYRSTSATFVVGITVLVSRLASFPVGLAVDRVGVEGMLIASSLGGGAALAGLALVPAPLYGAIVAAAIVQGVGSAGQSVAFSAWVARRLPGQATLGFSSLAIAFSLGGIVGPASTAPFVLHGNYRGLFAVAAALYAAAGAVLLISAGRRGPTELRQLVSAQSPRVSVSALLAGSFIALYFVTWALLQQLSVGLAKYFVDFFGSAPAAPAFFVMQSAAVILLFSAAGARMSRWNDDRLFLSYAVGTLLIPLAFFSLALFPRGAVALAVVTLTLLIALSELASVPSAGALVANLVPSTRQGSAFGVIGLVQACALTAGTCLGGFALDYSERIGWPPAYWIIVTGAFGGLGALALIAGLIALRQIRHHVLAGA